jgi:hypothetical protein
MPFLKTERDGELFVDHRASPGLPEDVARKLGLPPELVGEGKQMRAPTLGCPHCGLGVVLNPLRKRERAHCYQCDAYICDWCHAAMQEPDYVHLTIKEIVEKVSTGRWAIVGNSMSRLKLVPIGDHNG